MSVSRARYKEIFAPHPVWVEVVTGVSLVLWAIGLWIDHDAKSPTAPLVEFLGLPCAVGIPMMLGYVQAMLIVRGTLESRLWFAHLAFAWWVVITIYFSQTAEVHTAWLYGSLAISEWIVAVQLGRLIGNLEDPKGDQRRGSMASAAHGGVAALHSVDRKAGGEVRRPPTEGPRNARRGRA